MIGQIGAVAVTLVLALSSGLFQGGDSTGTVQVEQDPTATSTPPSIDETANDAAQQPTNTAAGTRPEGRGGSLARTGAAVVGFALTGAGLAVLGMAAWGQSHRAGTHGRQPLSKHSSLRRIRT